MAADDLPPTFETALRAAAANRELLVQYDRLNGTNLARKGTPLDLAIDDASGRSAEEFRAFARFVFEYIWLPVLEDRFRG